MLKALLLLVGQDMHHPDPAFGALCHGLDLVLEQYPAGGAAAVQDGQVKILDPVGNGGGHGVKRRDARAAGNGHDLLCVPQILIVEVPQGAADVHPVALFPGAENVGGGIGGVGLLDGQNVAGIPAAQSIFGIGADGVGLVDGRAVDVQRDGHILAGPEIGHFRGAPVRIGDQGEALGPAVIFHFGDLHMLHRRVQAPGQNVGVIDRLGNGVRRRLDRFYAGLDLAQKGKRRQALETFSGIIVFAHLYLPSFMSRSMYLACSAPER